MTALDKLITSVMDEKSEDLERMCNSILDSEQASESLKAEARGTIDSFNYEERNIIKLSSQLNSLVVAMENSEYVDADVEQEIKDISTMI